MVLLVLDFSELEIGENGGRWGSDPHILRFRNRPRCRVCHCGLLMIVQSIVNSRPYVRAYYANLFIRTSGVRTCACQLEWLPMCSLNLNHFAQMV
jgi:hypothetical protein